MSKPGYHIKERSFVARLAAKKLGVDNVAIVIGSTIHLYGRTKEELINNKKWLKHELCHIAQFHKHGFVPFIAKYLWESLRRGYYHNKYEVEARMAEGGI